LGRGRRFPPQLAAMILGGLVMSFAYFAVNVFVKAWDPRSHPSPETCSGKPWSP